MGGYLIDDAAATRKPQNLGTQRVRSEPSNARIFGAAAGFRLLQDTRDHPTSGEVCRASKSDSLRRGYCPISMDRKARTYDNFLTYNLTSAPTCAPKARKEGMLRQG